VIFSGCDNKKKNRREYTAVIPGVLKIKRINKIVFISFKREVVRLHRGTHRWTLEGA
jgi:hypothetical protein